jgi:hypothetical protein
MQVKHASPNIPGQPLPKAARAESVCGVPRDVKWFYIASLARTYRMRRKSWGCPSPLPTTHTRTTFYYQGPKG